ncbi:metal-dependent phosphohydrolase [Herbaspirillum huttiense]|uniref:metal-dependent phosphohydrolase n=1 Tax=Herbaspirillum huttiense TaxID=863372 RepID=UPI0039B02B91
MIAGIAIPDTPIARQADELARAVSSDVLYNHVMRCYFFGMLFAKKEASKVDDELMFLSAVLHDLGLTDHAPGPHRFEIEGALAAREFLVNKGVSPERAQNVWDNIALHTWDMNRFRGDTSRLMQLGLAYDVSGVPGAELDADDVAEVLRHYPRLHFKREFNAMLNHEIDTKQPYPHWFHICSRVAHNREALPIVDAPAVLNRAPFDE